MKTILTAIAAVAITVAALAGAPARAAITDVFDDAQEKAIQEIIRSYLLANPELLDEVIAELQRKREAEAAIAREEAIRKYLPELYKTDSKYARYSMGDGDVVLIEFMDYNCGFCRNAYSTLRDLYEEADIEVRFVEFPVLGPASILAAQAALAAEKQGKYLEFHDALMSLETRINDEEMILATAEEVGIDVEKMKQDMQAPEIRQMIEDNFQLAENLGVQGTPAIFVGETFISGAPQNFREELKQAIADARENCTVC